MRGLRALQQDFQDYVLRQQAGIHADIVGTEAVLVETRLDIYRQGHYLRLLEVLQLDFPGLGLLLGDHEFQVLVRRYIDAHPSTFRSLRWYGDQLATFLKNASPYCDQSVLAEMAWFEWLLMAAFDAEDAPVVSVEAMAGIPMEKWAVMHFTVHPAVKRVAFEWNITQIWNSIEADDVVSPECQAEAIEYLIWRRDRDVQFCSLSTDTAYMLDAMLAGQSFGDMCEGLCEWFPPEAVALHAASLLKRFIVDGIIQAVHY